jgi:hypothetical protein
MTTEQGIYVYAIGRSSDSSSVQLARHSDIYQVHAGNLVAFVQFVDLSEYSEEALKERADDQAWLIAQAQAHHQVIETLHQKMPVLPSKFGSAYASEDDVRHALQEAEQAMLRRLDKIDGCDEWSASIYLVGADLTQAALVRDPDLRKLAEQVEQASEGAKYMLRQRLQSRLKDAIEQYETEIARDAFDALHPLTAELQIESPREAEQTPEGEPEIARASMLVRRERMQEFIDRAEQTNDAIDTIWLKITGPWPAYSFAQLEDQEERVAHG